jgi:RimJ/RimL family protein N-acetyltransferase
MNIIVDVESISGPPFSIKRFLPEHWEQYRYIRLRALQTNPDLFGSQYQEEAAKFADHWKALLHNNLRAIFGLYDEDTLIGLTGVAVKQDNLQKAIFFSSFIEPSHRGQGLSKLFYKTRLAWAIMQGCTSIVVAHRVGNFSSQAAIQRSGFTYAGSENVEWPDGVFAEELRYELLL